MEIPSSISMSHSACRSPGKGSVTGSFRSVVQCSIYPLGSEIVANDSCLLRCNHGFSISSRPVLSIGTRGWWSVITINCGRPVRNSLHLATHPTSPALLLRTESPHPKENEIQLGQGPTSHKPTAVRQSQDPGNSCRCIT